MISRATPLMLLAVIVTTPAAAQPAPDPAHDQSIGGGAQWAIPFSGRGEKPGVQASWRRWFTPHVGVGTDLRWGSKHTTEEFNSFAQERSDGGVIPPVQRRVDQRISSYGLGVGVLARESIGRLSFIGGAGGGFFVDRSKSETRINGLRDWGRSSLRSFGLHMLLEVDVRVTSRLSAFAGLRSELRDVRDLESSFGYPTAGVRVAF